jgi:hypothetical protein
MNADKFHQSLPHLTMLSNQLLTMLSLILKKILWKKKLWFNSSRTYHPILVIHTKDGDKLIKYQNFVTKLVQLKNNS